MEEYSIFTRNDRVVVYDRNKGTWIRMSTDYFVKNKSEILSKYKGKEKDKNNKIKMLYLSLTRKCNMACEFCSSNSSPDVDTTGELSFEEIEEKLIPVIEKINPHNLIISGGEPLTRLDILDIIDSFSTRFPKTSIMLQTNGLLINENVLKAIKKKISYIEISIEDMFYSHSFYKRLLKILKLIKLYGIQMQFSYVISKDNVQNMPKVLELVVEFEATIILRFVSPVGRAVNKKIQFMRVEDIQKYYLDMIDLIIERYCGNEKIVDIVLPILQSTESCGAYGKILYMNPEGRVSLCSGLDFAPYILGDIRANFAEMYSGQLKKVLSQEEVQNKLLVNRMVRCKDCDIKYFCCGICAAKTYNTSDEQILYADCEIKKVLVFFWLFDFDKNKSIQDNLKKLRERIVYEYSK